MEQSPASDGDRAPTARDCSPGEASRLRRQFKPMADANRQRTASAAGWLCATVAAGVLYFVLPTAFEPFLFFAGLGLLVKTVHALWSTPRPLCPGCAGEIHPVTEDAFGEYCPDCGSRSLERGAWNRSPHCRACDRTITTGSRGIPHRTRVCTHCGLRLDGVGL